MITFNLQELLGKGYNNGFFLNCDCRYRCFEGARSTKKSVDIGGYEPLIKLITSRYRNVVMARKDDVNNSQSTYANLVNLIYQLGWQDKFKITKNPLEIVYKPFGNKIIFRGCNNPDAIMSTKFPVGEFTDLYFEEASELSSYEAFRKMDGSLRSSKQKVQITFLLNGWDKKSWIYDTFFKDRLEDDYNYLETHDYQDYRDDEFSLGQDSKGLYLHKSTYKINEFRSSEKDESARKLKEIALEIYKVECLGMWGNTRDKTYLYFNDNLIKPIEELTSNNFCAFTIGIDIGMGNGEGKIIKNTKNFPDRYRSAMTMSLFGLTEDREKMITLDEWFFSNENREIKKGSPEVAEDMIFQIINWKIKYAKHPQLFKSKILCYVDSADSGGFRTLLESKAKELELFNINFIASTKNKIQTRVDFSNLMMAYGDFLVCDTCKNLIREIKNARADEDGSPREDCDDHMINANEYAWIPLLKEMRRWKTFKEH